MFAATSLRKSVRYGNLTVFDAKGHAYTFSGNGGPTVVIRLTDSKLHWRLFHNAQLAMGEAYTNGTLIIEKGTLYDFLDICCANLRSFEGSNLQRLLGLIRRLYASIRTYNPVGKAKRKVAHHYDLRDELFDLFLDTDRQYSCAYFLNFSDDIETAQHQKNTHIAAKLILEKGHSELPLNIGCRETHQVRQAQR